MAASVLITDSEALADAVAAELDRQVPATKHAERIRTALDGQQSAIVLVRDLDQAVDVANAYAAEHLEIHTADAADVAARIVNAGAIFVGPHTPVSLGDYVAGSNHVLPTGGMRLPLVGPLGARVLQERAGRHLLRGGAARRRRPRRRPGRRPRTCRRTVPP